MNRGFSLLEVLITLVLLTGGVIAICQAFSAGMFASTDVENVDLALNLAQARIETVYDVLKDTDISSLNIGNFEASYGYEETDFEDYDIAVDLASSGDPRNIKVTVTWNVKGGQADVELIALVAE